MPSVRVRGAAGMVAMVAAVCVGALAHSAAGQAAYTVRELGKLDGFDYAVNDLSGGQCLNNAGQAIFWCVETIREGDPLNGITPIYERAAVLYTPGSGLTRLGTQFTQNFVHPYYLNDQGQVFGRVAQLDYSYGPAPQYQTMTTTTQQRLWLHTPGSGTQELAVPQEIVDEYVPLIGSDSMLSNGGVTALSSLDRSTFVEEGGTIGPEGWLDYRTLDPSIQSARMVSLSAVADNGEVVGSTILPFQGFWKQNTGLQLIPSMIPRSIRDDGSLIAGDLALSEGGSHACVMARGGAIQDIHVAAHGTESHAANLAGPYLYGMYFTSSGSPAGAFRWDSRDGTTKFLPIDAFALSMGTRGMNAAGTLIGEEWLDIDPFSPWVWKPDAAGGAGEKMYLRDAIGDPDEVEWDFRWAIDINDRGEILAYAANVQTDEGRVVILDPVDSCVADFNGSGAVSVQDIFDFLTAYFSSDPRADVNGSGAVTVQDIFDFLSAYFTGC